MIAKQLKQIFDPYVSLNLQVWENFEKLGTVEHFSRETVLKAANAKERYLNIILKGSGGNLVWNKTNFVCIDIAFENEFLCDYMSFILEHPTPIEVRLFEDATVFRISHANFQQTFQKGNYGDRITGIIEKASFLEKQQQQIDLLTKSAKERYIELLATRNGIARMPLKYLASYLGVTPQSLSRIRAGKM